MALSSRRMARALPRHALTCIGLAGASMLVRRALPGASEEDLARAFERFAHSRIQRVRIQHVRAVVIEKLPYEAGAPWERTAMVGDSAVDVRTARNARVQACGVAWGFQPETFAEAPPDFVIGEMGELVERVLRFGLEG